MNLLNKLYNKFNIKIKKPCISIIIPVYNNSQYIDECLSSVINQSLKDLEIIIINDGSTEIYVEQILASYVTKDNRIKLINKNNTGYGHTMNVGISAASGEYIGIVESDDYVHKEFYSNLLHTAKKTGAEVIKSHGWFFTGKNKDRKYKLAPALRNCVGKYVKITDKVQYFRGIPLNQFGIYKKSFLLANNITFTETPGASFQDIGFYFRVAVAAKNIFIFNEPLYYVRRDNKCSSVAAKDKMECPIYEYERLEKYLNENPKLKKIYAPYLNLRKFFSYKFTLGRLAPEYHKEFIDIFKKQWLAANKRGEISYKMFTDSELKWLLDTIFK